MSPSDELYGRVIERIENIMETVRSPRFLFFAFICSIKETFERILHI